MLPDKQYLLARDIVLAQHQIQRIQSHNSDFYQLPQIFEIADKSLKSPNNQNVSLKSLLTNDQAHKREDSTSQPQSDIEERDDSDETDGDNNYCSDTIFVKKMNNERTTVTLKEHDNYSKLEALATEFSNIAQSNDCQTKGQEANEERCGFAGNANNHSNFFDKRRQQVMADNNTDVASQHHTSNDDKQNLDTTGTQMMADTNSKPRHEEYRKVFNETIDSDDAVECSGNNHTTANTAVEKRNDAADNCKVYNVKHNECHKTFASCSSLESAAEASLHVTPTNQTTQNMSHHIKPEEYVAIPSLMTAATFSSSPFEHSENHKFQSHEAMNQPTFSSVSSVTPSYDFMQQSYQHHQLYQYHHPHQDEPFRSHHQTQKQYFQHHPLSHQQQQQQQQRYMDTDAFRPPSHVASRENYGVCSTSVGAGESSTTTSLTIW
ncbi:cAMP-dependent protein kinase catalytic subunit-like [Musca domestica]|uniref:cAMP-dependent protein kinase catalytic subunit-like n=1 Tax=Musca domestica TaxID=7370 RepID=A0A1I8MHX6_MUSDO|nr:cAMP-dependent protein kinase catalytic subunit-like [Musca domestica]